MDKLKIFGFKCFKKAEFDINKITVLTGINGSGKSSVMQTLLLLRQGIERCIKQDGNKRVWNEEHIDLNKYRCLQLGSFDDICNNESAITFVINDVLFELSIDDEDVVTLKLKDGSVDNLPDFITQKEFYYLNAERIGPRIDSKIAKVDMAGCGDKGEWSGNVLLNASQTLPNVETERCFHLENGVKLTIQLDQWMSYIFSDVAIKSERLTSEICQIKLRNDIVTSIAPNTGFGYTYALPIVLNCLLAKKGSAVLVENPEAHLHPKAQSNIGFLLGKMAAAGLRIVIETHSEHVVNGIRRATLSNLGLTSNDLTIYFFNNSESIYDKIVMDEMGNLSDFPVDFFDQVRQDMLEIISLANKHK